MRYKMLCIGIVVISCLWTITTSIDGADEEVTVFATVPGLSGFTTAKDGSIYALSSAEDKIVRFSPDGEVMQTIGPSLEGGYSLEISPYLNPIHVDSSGLIYLPSRKYLFILDTSGHILNLDLNGKRPKGFEVGAAQWIGTNKRGDIYVYPAIDDKDSLISVITAEGTRLSNFGGTVLPRGKVPNTFFRIAMAQDDTLYAVFSNFPAMLKYRPDQSFDSLIRIPLGNGLKELIASQDVSLDEALKAVSMNERVRQNHLIFTDATFIDENTLVCISSAHILWYDKSGKLLRQFNQVHFMAAAGSGKPISDAISGCNGNCLLCRSQLDDKIYKIAP